MTKDDSTSSILFGDWEDVRLLADWQQQQYHHLRTLAQALLGGSLTVLAIIATLAVNTSGFAFGDPPKPNEVEAAAETLQFSSLGLSLFFGLNLLLVIPLALFAGLTGVYAMYKLYDIVASPPLQPRLENSIVLAHSGQERCSLTNSSFQTVKRRLLESITANRETINSVQEKFKQALVRIPIAIMIGFFAAQLYSFVSSLKMWELLYMNIALVLPASIWKAVRSKFYPSFVDTDSGYTSIGHALLIEDSERFPNEFTRVERILADFSSALAFVALVILILDQVVAYLL